VSKRGKSPQLMRGPLGLNHTPGATLGGYSPLIAFIALCGGFWDQTGSCTCVKRMPVSGHPAVEEIAGAQALDGMVLSITYSPAPTLLSPGKSPLAERVAAIVVNRRWNSTGSDTVLIRTAAYTTACGFSFTNGDRYLLFPRSWHGDLYVDKCGLSRAWDAEAQRLSHMLNRRDQAQ
jgi:hypothetical protein